MKRLSTIIMALALVLGMSQCKKQETPTNGDSGEKVYVTLNVSNGESIAVNVDNGGRHAVAPNLGVIQFRNGDVLYVGYHGKYIGQLTYNNGAFGGTLNAPIDGVHESLHFYFLGGKAPATAPTAGTTDDFTINIADQSTNLPVLCYGASSQEYVEGGSYTAVLEYKCALVRFKLNKTTDYKCTLSNMLTEATIDFANNAITPTETTGNIDLYAEDGNWGVRWAILLPGTDLTSDDDDNDLNTTGYQGQADLANLQNNDYINSGITLTNPVFAAPGADYAVKRTSDGVLTQFSVSESQKVYFSRANLKYNTTTHVWSFHTNQIDECPGAGSSTSGGTGSVSLDGGAEMDRFCWGFVGNTSVSATDDWVDGSRNLNWTDGTDWGCALEGTAYGDHWRTLTAAEWEYLLKRNQTHSFLRVAWKQMGIPNWTIAGVTGIIIAPDDYAGGSSYSEWNQVNKIHKFNTDVASVNALLADGCVFLPALGYRDNDKYKEYDYHRPAADGTYMKGNYWTATGVDHQHNSVETPQATAFRFELSTIKYAYAPKRDLGMCVRLVWDAN